MDTYISDYLAKADENFSLYTFLEENNKFEGWQLVAIFYSALCFAKAYLYNKNFPKNSINSHDSIKRWLSSETEAKRLNVLYYYENLYRDSRDARYSTKKISKARIKKALENYEVVKKLLAVK